MRRAVTCIAAGVAGLVVLSSWGVVATATEPSRAPEPIVVARANLIAPTSDFATPPALLAQTVVPAAQPIAAPAAAVLPHSIVRAVTPEGSEPGVLWLIAMGAVLCRVGARLLRVS